MGSMSVDFEFVSTGDTEQLSIDCIIEEASYELESCGSGRITVQFNDIDFDWLMGNYDSVEDFISDALEITDGEQVVEFSAEYFLVETSYYNRTIDIKFEIEIEEFESMLDERGIEE